MLDQYRRIKRNHKEEVLFFRLGDFYEMFDSDALEVSALLNLTLTSRNGQPMCGIPYHAARSYIARLLKFGKKIAICEQVSEPMKGRQVIDRQVVEIITPGTTVEEDYLDRGSSNYLACLSLIANYFSFAYIDLSAGDFHATSFSADEAEGKLCQELERLQIREMLIQESLLNGNSGISRALKNRGGLVLNRWADWLFEHERAKKRLEKQFLSLKSFGLGDASPELLSAGALLDYLDETSKCLIPHVRAIDIYQDAQYVGIDEASQRNLELVRNLQDGETSFSLLEVMDQTRCAMGRRLLKWRILHPLRDLGKIADRQGMVEGFYRDQGVLASVREIMGKTPDLQRLCSRLAMDKAHGKDMLAIKNALVFAIELKALWKPLEPHFESERNGDNDEVFERMADLRELLERGICLDPPILLSDGNLIRAGYSQALDELRRPKDSGRQLLEEYLEEEKRQTGIISLKIHYTRLIGYFFEVKKNNLSKVPSHFIRRQGIAAGERFSTERLAALESDINSASDKIVELERKLFLEIRDKAKLCLNELAAVARCIAEIDVAQSLAKAASINDWIRPDLDNSGCFEVLGGRHPVVEAHIGRAEFIPNDITLDSQGSISPVSFALITGPNMAGKSTYLRSAALISIMAQAGSFVPASKARLGLCDRIYCRVGASDNLARGESTFLVEMNETAYILNTATQNSLVIMDEVGRGTGTKDGLSIAWAVSEELLNRLKCRTLFATHYHELSLISHPRMANRSMEVLEKDGEIIFLRKLKEGATEESYGIHVARLAGLSEAVLERAQGIMARLRGREANLRQFIHIGQGDDLTKESPPASVKADISGKQENQKHSTLIRDLQTLDENSITPFQALEHIGKWKKQLSQGETDTPANGKSRANPARNKQDDAPSLFGEQ
jgi:DNA mismatch repair protein MutS